MTPQAKLKCDMYGFGAGEAKDIQKELDKSRGGNFSKLTAKTLAEDDSFTDLPFEQLRQALREEVELDPHRDFKTLPSKRYNLLIR